MRTQQNGRAVSIWSLLSKTILCAAATVAALTPPRLAAQASHLDLELAMLRPGIRVTTTPKDYQPIKQLFLIRFDGKEWMPIGPISTE